MLKVYLLILVMYLSHKQQARKNNLRHICLHLLLLEHACNCILLPANGTYVGSSFSGCSSSIVAGLFSFTTKKGICSVCVLSYYCISWFSTEICNNILSLQCFGKPEATVDKRHPCVLNSTVDFFSLSSLCG